MQHEEISKNPWFGLQGLVALAFGLLLLNSGYIRWRDDPSLAGSFSEGQTSSLGGTPEQQALATHKRMWTDATMVASGSLFILLSVWLFDRKGRG